MNKLLKVSFMAISILAIKKIVDHANEQKSTKIIDKLPNNLSAHDISSGKISAKTLAFNCQNT